MKYLMNSDIDIYDINDLEDYYTKIKILLKEFNYDIIGLCKFISFGKNNYPCRFTRNV